MSNEEDNSSWLEPLPEEYTAEGDMTGRRMLVAALTVIVLAIFGGLIWYSYLKGNDDGPVPVVHADKSVVKEKPDNPGGLEVPDQDKRVFDRIASGQSENSEQLGPSAELPLERPADTKSIKTAMKKAAKAERESQKAPLPPQKEAENAVRIMAGKYLVQLGAFGHEDSAEKLWRKLRQDNISLLGDLAPHIKRLDLGKKGVLYRLRGGTIADKATATTICKTLKAKKQACIVVKK